MAGGTDGEDLARELDRVSGRLRVLGPRFAAGQRPEALDLVRDTLQTLADLGADAERRPRRPVPELAPHGLADQFLVLGHDLLAAGDPGSGAVGLAALVALRRAL